MPMTDKKIKEVLTELLVLVQEEEPDVRPEKVEDDATPNEWGMIGHLKYMGPECLKFLEEGRREKLMRWLGFMQGVLWARGVVTLDYLKRLNMPQEGSVEPTGNSTRKFYKTTVTLEVLSEDEPVSPDIDVLDLANEVVYGDMSGRLVIGNNVEELNGYQAAQALLQQDSEPGFFCLDEEGNDA